MKYYGRISSRGQNLRRREFMENEKKKYSIDELFRYAYKHNQIPEILFAKDKECRYIFTSEIESLINGGN